MIRWISAGSSSDGVPPPKKMVSAGTVWDAPTLEPSSSAFRPAWRISAISASTYRPFSAASNRPRLKLQ